MARQYFCSRKGGALPTRDHFARPGHAHGPEGLTNLMAKGKWSYAGQRLNAAPRLTCSWPRSPRRYRDHRGHRCLCRLPWRMIGRLRGSRNKLSEAVICALLRDFSKHGEKAIAKVRRDHPGIYLKVLALLIPRQDKLEHTNTI